MHYTTTTHGQQWSGGGGSDSQTERMLSPITLEHTLGNLPHSRHPRPGLCAPYISLTDPCSLLRLLKFDGQADQKALSTVRVIITRVQCW